MSGGGYRLFVAVDPPAVVAAELTAWARAHRGPSSALRPMPPANIHLTLAFLGSQPAGDVDAILGAIGAAVHEFTLGGPRGPIHLETTGPAWLPPRRPRTLVVDVDDPSGELADLRRALVSALATAIGWEDDRPRFRPHLTAGRLSGPLDRPVPLEPTPSLEFTVDEVTLYRSFLGPAGARYEALGATSLV